jgi:hypothetical protein
MRRIFPPDVTCFYTRNTRPPQPFLIETQRMKSEKAAISERL